jgi:hypothetical protein
MEKPIGRMTFNEIHSEIIFSLIAAGVFIFIFENSHTILWLLKALAQLSLLLIRTF